MKVVRDIKACVSGHASSGAGSSSEPRHNATKYFSERSHANGNIFLNNSSTSNNVSSTAVNNSSSNYHSAKDFVAPANNNISINAVKPKPPQPTTTDRSLASHSSMKSMKPAGKMISAQPNEDYGQFILTLYDVVTDVQEKSTQWYQDNASFWIVNPVLFICQTLPKYFRCKSSILPYFVPNTCIS